MLNTVNLMGRLVRDVEVKATENGKVLNNAIAVQGPKDHTDFINFSAWNGTADLIEKYVKKGDQFIIEGRIRTNSYDKDGQTIYTTEVVANRVVLLDNRARQQQAPEA